MGLEILTGGLAGGLAGLITTPLDVVKTRIQTQIRKPRHGPQLSRKPNTLPAFATSSRQISTSSPSTTITSPEATKLNTSSVMVGLKLIYKHEGVRGLFSGVGPRLVWTSTQSGTMLLLYRSILKVLHAQQMC